MLGQEEQNKIFFVVKRKHCSQMDLISGKIGLYTRHFAEFQEEASRATQSISDEIKKEIRDRTVALFSGIVDQFCDEILQYSPALEQYVRMFQFLTKMFPAEQEMISFALLMEKSGGAKFLEVFNEEKFHSTIAINEQISQIVLTFSPDSKKVLWEYVTKLHQAAETLFKVLNKDDQEELRDLFVKAKTSLDEVTRDEESRMKMNQLMTASHVERGDSKK